MAADALAAVLLGTYWARQGTRVLLVYSRSSHWRSYIEAAWLPRLAGQAVVINWSDRDVARPGGRDPGLSARLG